LHREQDSRGRFVSRGRGGSSIPTSTTILTRPCSTTPSTNTFIPFLACRHRLPEVHRYEIQPRDSPTSSTNAVVEEPTLPTEGVVFLSSTGEQLLGKEV